MLWNTVLAETSRISEETVAVVVLIGTFTVGVIAMLTGIWYRFMRMFYDSRLKQSMIERGMSVEEIERVLAAKSREK